MGISRNLSLLDLLTVFSLLIDISNAVRLKKQSSNDDLLKELNKDVDKLMKKLEDIKKE